MYPIINITIQVILLICCLLFIYIAFTSDNMSGFNRVATVAICVGAFYFILMNLIKNNPNK